MMMQCNGCGGTYASTLPDGSDYFHTCPPLSVSELRAALEARTLTMPAAVRARVDAAAKVDATRAVDDETPLAVDGVLGALVVVRPGHRDENVTGPARDKHSDAPIVSAGAGAVELPDTLDEPIAIAAPAPRPMPLTP